MKDNTLNIFALGRVRELADDGRLARVELIAEEGCAFCGGDKKGCGGVCGRLFASGMGNTFLVENSTAARPGQRVLLAARRRVRLSASMLIFFVPLLVFAAACIAGYALFDGHELAAFGLAAAAAAVYYFLLHIAEKRRTKKHARLVWIARVFSD